MDFVCFYGSDGSYKKFNVTPFDLLLMMIFYKVALSPFTAYLCELSSQHSLTSKALKMI